MSTRTLEMKSWRITTMVNFLFWIGVYLALVMIGGHAGAGWAVVASLLVLYGVGVFFKKKVETYKGRCNVKKED